MYGVWPSPLSYMDINGCFIIRVTNGEMTIPQEWGCNPIFLTMANGYGLQMVYPKQSRVCTQKNNEFVSPLPVPVLWAQCAFKRSSGWICFYGWSKQIAASWTSQMYGNSSKLWGPPRAIAVIFALWIGSKNCISWSGKMVGPFNQSMVLFAGRIEVWHPDNAEIYSDSEKESQKNQQNLHL